MSFEIKYNDQPTPHGMHTHTYYEMLYVLSGAAVITVRGRAYECGPGSLIFLNPFDEHASHPLELPYKRYYLLMPVTQLKAFHNDVLLLSVFRFHGDQFPYAVQVGDLKPRFDSYFSLLMDVQKEGGSFADTRMEALNQLKIMEETAAAALPSVQAAALSAFCSLTLHVWLPLLSAKVPEARLFYGKTPGICCHWSSADKALMHGIFLFGRAMMLVLKWPSRIGSFIVGKQKDYCRSLCFWRNCRGVC